jgi:hypothetical protein
VNGGLSVLLSCTHATCSLAPSPTVTNKGHEDRSCDAAASDRSDGRRFRHQEEELKKSSLRPWDLLFISIIVARANF